MERCELHIVAEISIHTRPAILLIQVASKFNSDINLKYSDKLVSLESIMGVMSLGVGRGVDITITADGGDAKEAIEAVADTMKKEGLAE